jgi:hypothetical protein
VSRCTFPSLHSCRLPSPCLCAFANGDHRQVSRDTTLVQRVYLVSPTWLFRPATPLWSYVEQTDLSGKEVVLITTGNSRFEQAGTDEFAKRVEARGGRLVRHVFLRRGRIFWQMTREELLDAVRAQVGEGAVQVMREGS